MGITCLLITLELVFRARACVRRSKRSIWMQTTIVTVRSRLSLSRLLLFFFAMLIVLLFAACDDIGSGLFYVNSLGDGCVGACTDHQYVDPSGYQCIRAYCRVFDFECCSLTSRSVCSGARALVNVNRTGCVSSCGAYQYHDSMHRCQCASSLHAAFVSRLCVHLLIVSCRVALQGVHIM